MYWRLIKAQKIKLNLNQVRFNSSVPAVEVKIQPGHIKQAKQASNRVATWSESQQDRLTAYQNPRFEQVDLSTQPQPQAAIELIHEEPIRMVEGRIASCNGGGGALGHPKVYINLDKEGAHPCNYCGLRFQQKPHHH